MLKFSGCREVASVGGQFQNSFETPTALGSPGSVVARLTARLTAVEGYSDSPVIKRPGLVPGEQSGQYCILLVSSPFLLNTALAAECGHRLKFSLCSKGFLCHSLKVSQNKYYNLDFKLRTSRW